MDLFPMEKGVKGIVSGWEATFFGEGGYPLPQMMGWGLGWIRPIWGEGGTRVRVLEGRKDRLSDVTGIRGRGEHRLDKSPPLRVPSEKRASAAAASKKWEREISNKGGSVWVTDTAKQLSFETKGF
ncbi:hypothetical protein AVEN_110445-1 [Araneus ventricosus]|uniref:Uncharacterized protein n=1 Tax=Araneus ventricosus TaxID=182803 RepID=A0A4Y2HYB6_ARAVE|nr:hypothetical protein AVEN_110445-1 [Araneus ventricosus]